jgi:hypothetical protein
MSLPGTLWKRAKIDGRETIEAKPICRESRLRAWELQRLWKSVTVDRSVCGSVCARLPVTVRTILRKHKYPPDEQDAATETVRQQAELLSAAWVVT